MAQNTASVMSTQLTVRDFGPISEADVELRPLTIFLGPTNTGKSYLAKLAYSLSRYLFTADYVSLATLTSSDRESVKPTEADKASPGGFRKEPGPPTSPRSQVHSAAGNALPPNAPSGEMDEVLEILSGLMLDDRSVMLPKHCEFGSVLRQTFEVEDTQELGRGNAKHSAQVMVRGSGAMGEELAKFRASLNSPTAAAELFLSPKLGTGQLPVLLHDIRKQIAQDSESDSNLYLPALKQLARWCEINARVRSHRPFGLLEQGAQYLPAGRSGAVKGHRAIMASLVQLATQGNLRSSDTMPALPKMLGEYFLNLMDTRNQRSPYAGIADALERDILGGRILDDQENDLGYPNLFYHPGHWSAQERIPLTTASSMITELAPIVLYLRHVVKENELLIIEEPEAHLHPAMQAELAVYLAKLVNNGLRVLLTTHSEWLLEQFSNLVRLSEISRGQQKTIEAQHPSVVGSALDANQVGAWVFTPPKGNRGSTVEEFALNDGSGMMPDQYAVVMKRLYDEWRQIAHHLDTEAA